MPGHHRSAAGLAHFEALFCAARSGAARGLGLTFGGWETHQRHPFFAMPLPHRWWLWGVDIRYDQELGADQFNYFALTAEHLSKGDKLIVCGPPENWLRSEFDGWPEQANLQKVLALAEKAGAKVRVLITGGRREYVHARMADRQVELFEVGGGRSFVAPSHWAPRKELIRWEGDASARQDGSAASIPPARRRNRADFEAEQHFWALTGRETSSITEDLRLGTAKVIYAAENPPTLAAGAPARARPATGDTATVVGEYPSRSRSAVLTMRNLLYPFLNPRYALGLGIVYWLVTWQFQTLVTRYNISGGKIDDLGLTTSLGDVLAALPIYLTSAMIVDFGLALMLCAMLVLLVSLVAIRGAGIVHRLAKVCIGTAHFLCHLIAMFTLSLAVVMLNNVTAAPIERALNTLYSERQEQSPIVRDVIEESLKPLQRSEERGVPAPAPLPPRPSPVRELVGCNPTALRRASARIGSGNESARGILAPPTSTGMIRLP